MEFFPSREIVIAFGPMAIHWYGVMYLLAFLAAWVLIPLLARKRGIDLSYDDVGTLLFAGILGTIIGGRLGYVFFYDPQYYLAYPLSIFAVWKGGMSSHGGFLGVSIALFVVYKHLETKVSLLQLADILVIPVAIGLAFGRMGNFINLELYGPITDLPWAIAIPGVDGFRHPTPLYAVLKNLSIALLCFVVFLRTTSEGIVAGVFFVAYGIFRFLIEYVRIETSPGFDFFGHHLTRGQLLTIPVFIIGLIILWKNVYKNGRI